MESILNATMPVHLDDKKLVKTECPICESNSGTYEKKLKINDVDMYLDHCHDCSLWWVNPRPPLDYYIELYENYFYNSPCPDHFGYANRENDGQRRMDKAKKNFDDFMPYIEKQKRNAFLEIGCANGELLLEAQARGWSEVFGVEIDKACCDAAREKGINIYSGTFETMDSHDQKMDVIFADNVIEHLLEPFTAIQKCQSMQDKGGHLIFRLPETMPDGPTLKLIDHTYHFDRKSISLILEKAGYRVEEILHTGTYYGENGIDFIKNMTVIATNQGH